MTTDQKRTWLKEQGRLIEDPEGGGYFAYLVVDSGTDFSGSGWTHTKALNDLYKNVKADIRQLDEV